MPIPPEVTKLIERFQQNIDDYRSGRYNETQVRREFIDPLFIALGWDVANERGAREAYKDVIHEDAIKIGDALKAPDYAFRMGDTRKFFVEAKKPSINVKLDAHPAFQVRRYGWSAKLTLSIVTDFEEFAVYDCRIEPGKKDKAETARILYLTYDQYADRWDEIAGLFSRDAVLNGSLERFADEQKAGKGATPVDTAFLRLIEQWRDKLARNIAPWHTDLNQQAINYAVQMTIDRIIFLRICEDRGIEPYGKLLALVNGGNIYARLCDLFKQADRRYNSGLFHFDAEKGRETPDTLTLGLHIEDEPLRDIIKDLYPPNSPYAFAVIPIEILGQVYEQFLGKVIRLDWDKKSGRRIVEVEYKPEVRKAGGVYYTPTYIVDYIVRHTVGKLLADKTPEQAAYLRILDPACGSGSFLIGAYQYLLDWYRDWYVSDGPDKHPQQVYQAAGGAWRLTTAARKRILLHNLYGVDIDPQAVETTKLSLLLRVLEGETDEGINHYLKVSRERALPDLAANVKCGNSLIGYDFMDGKALDQATLARVNPFDWQAEFPAVMQAGGFDAVIGNPPYGAELLTSEIEHLRKQFHGISQGIDSYELFLAKASHLLRQDGMLSMIIPASWLTGEKYTASRKSLVTSLTPMVAYAMPFDVFKAAYIDTAIVVFANSTTVENCLIRYFPKREKLAVIPDGIGTSVPVSNIRSDSLNRLSIVLSDQISPILSKLKASPFKFGDWFRIQRGVQPYSRKKHTEEQITQKFLHASSALSEEYLPELQGNELSRYWVASKRTSYIRYCNQIASSRPMYMFEGKRIVLRRLLTRKFRLQACMVTETMITTDNVLNLTPCNSAADVAFALAILNSRIISWFYVNTSMVAQKDDFPQVHISALSALPIPTIDKARHDHIVGLVEQLLALHQQAAAAHTPQESTRIQRQIDATDRQLDRLVYELYGLSDAEVRIVEGL